MENNDQKINGSNGIERLYLTLPIGTKEGWKKKSKNRKFGALWKYIRFLIENDIKDNELPPKSVELLEKLYAENQVLRDKMELLVDKIGKLEEIMTTKTLIKKILSEKEQQKILEYAAPGKKLSEIANYIEKEEIVTLAILDSLEGMGKIKLNTENSMWISIE